MPINTPQLASIWSAYIGEPEHFDEAIDGDALRPAWRGLSQRMDVTGVEEISKRWAAAQRTLQDNGVTYNIHHEDQASARIWKLDPIPLVIDGNEWKTIEAGITQRVRLLNQVLDDFYGMQRLISDGTLPPELLWANPGFLRPVHGFHVPGDHRIVSYAADLGRSADGQWWVISDRTQAPSGAGYALENRIVTSRVWPQAFRDNQVHRLAGYFSAFRDTLRTLAPQHKDDPSIVLLTPGPYAETYFEHAYLARYLGMPLVEGRDLTVRDDRVYMKTLTGLHPVDVIIRRVDDDYCDPLELREDSALGVTGLVRAVRAGRVALANALGAGVIEAAAMMPFHPMLCRQLLGEQEKLPSVATWWCGQAKERQHVLANLERMVVKSAFRASFLQPVFGADLTQTQREALTRRIETQPHMYVGQELMPLSSAPVWLDGALHPRMIMLRVFATYDGQSGYRVMPGGMTRVAPESGSRIVSMHQGGGSKDTWVTSDVPIDRVSLLPQPGGPIQLVRGGVDMPSRVAEDLFWLGRHLQRIHDMARLLRVIVRCAYEENDADSDDTSSLTRALAKLVGEKKTDTLVQDSIKSTEATFGLWWNAGQARRLGGTVRDVVSDDVWRVISRLQREVQLAAAATHDPVTLLDHLDALMLTISGLVGYSHDGMTRSHGYWFLELGRRIEYATSLTRILGPVLTPTAPATLLIALLQACDSIKTYRSRYRALVAPVAACDLLVLDETNPRSLAFQLAEISRHIDQLPHPGGPSRLDAQQRAILSMLTRIRLADPHALMQGRHLSQLLADLAIELAQLSDLLARHYLAHAQPPSKPRIQSEVVA